MTKLMKSATALGFAAALAASVPNIAVAAPFTAGGGEALKSAAPSNTTDVHWRGRGWGRGWGWGAALGTGLVLGGALAYPAYRSYYYGPGPGYYGYGAPQRCWVQTGPYRGQGYWAAC